MRFLMTCALLVSLWLGALGTAHAFMPDHGCPSVETSLNETKIQHCTPDSHQVQHCSDCEECCHTTHASLTSLITGFVSPLSESATAFQVKNSTSFIPLGIRRPPRG